VRALVHVAELGDEEALLDADVDWWLAFPPDDRIRAVDRAKDEIERMEVGVARRPAGTNPDYETLLALLNEARARFLIVGGYAVAFHSTPRFTKDIDLLVKPSRANARRVRGALEEFVGPIDVSLERLSKPGLVLMMGLPPTRVDVLTAIDGVTFDQAWKGRVKGKYGEESVFYIGIDALIRTKKTVGRDQDRADVRRLLRSKKRTVARK
jgi:hypothetical protein